jgi:hypothetical protein
MGPVTHCGAARRRPRGPKVPGCFTLTLPPGAIAPRSTSNRLSDATDDGATPDAAPAAAGGRSSGGGAAAAAAAAGTYDDLLAAAADPAAAEQLESSLAEVEATAFASIDELGWLGRVTLPAGDAVAGAAAGGCDDGGGGALVTCRDCKRVVLRARAGAHAERCLARRQLAERQQQALLLRAAQQQRPSTPPTSNLSKPAGSGRGGKHHHHHHHHHHKGSKRQSSNLGPHRQSLNSPGGADGRPPLPRGGGGRGPGRPASVSPLNFPRGAGGALLDGEFSPLPLSAGGAMGGGYELDESHPGWLARHVRRQRSATPTRWAGLWCLCVSCVLCLLYWQDAGWLHFSVQRFHCSPVCIPPHLSPPNPPLHNQARPRLPLHRRPQPLPRLRQRAPLRLQQ